MLYLAKIKEEKSMSTHQDNKSNQHLTFGLTLLQLMGLLAVVGLVLEGIVKLF